MKILFDHNLPKRFRHYVPGHEVSTAREMSWETLSNGILLKAAADAGFEVFVSVDKNIEREQNLTTLPLPVVVLDAESNALPALVQFAPFLLRLLNTSMERAFYVIEPMGSIRRISSARE